MPKLPDRFAPGTVLSVLLIFAATQVAAHTGEGINTGFRQRVLASDPWLGSRGGDGGRWFVGRVPRRARDLDPAGGLSAGHGAGRRVGCCRACRSPMIETGIALSGVVLGLLIAFAVKAPIWAAAVIVGLFAIFHGHAHGTELPDAFSPYGYAMGFVVGTGLLALGGHRLWRADAVGHGAHAVRGAGGCHRADRCGLPVRPRLKVRCALLCPCRSRF
jgi:urease accessory protein